ncbi:MAG TPA: cytochrome P450 [Pseudonocardia sp.]
MPRFDHHTEDFAREWRTIYDQMRRDCPVARTDAHGGYTVLTRYEDVKRALNSPDVFASGRSFGELPGLCAGVTVPPNPVRMGMMEMDPPESTGYRRALAPRFSAKAVDAYAPRLREIVRWAVDRIVEQGTLDFVDDLANPVPAMVSLDYFGLPLENWERYARVLHSAVYREAGSAKEIHWLVADLRRIVAERRATSRDTGDGGDDIVGSLMTGTVRGEPIGDEMVVELLFMLLNGGIDTSTALIAHMFRCIDRYPEMRSKLAADFSLIPNAVEEMLRYVAPTPGLARTVVRPTVLRGRQLEPGERVFLAFASANADPEVFPDGDTIDIGRHNASKHLSFGSGVHRCLGAFLAPAEMAMLLEEVLRRIPDYRIDRSQVRPYPRIPIVNGLMHLPATFTPGHRLLTGFDADLPIRGLPERGHKVTTSASERDYPELLSHFDLFNPDHEEWKYDAFRYARRHCPIVHTDAVTGFWIITRYEHLRQVAEDHDTFSSVNGSPGPTPFPLGPLMSDPPLHTGLRKLLNPLFSRTYCMRFEDDIRATCRELIGGFIDDGRFDAVKQYAGPVVSRTIARMVFDEPDREKMRRANVITDAVTEESTPQSFVDLAGLASEYLQAARRNPPEQDGVLRRLVTGTLEHGEPVPDEAALGTLMVLFLGGLDTTKAAIAHICMQIARHGELEGRVRNPRWVRHDLDEFIRLQSPVATFARHVTRDVEIGGVHMRKGDRVLLRFDSANRDEHQFPDPDELRFDPPRGGNAGFGLGIHRCIGAHLGRVQIALAMDELLARTTNFTLGCDPADIVWKPGISNCPDRIPLTFDKLATPACRIEP